MTRGLAGAGLLEERVEHLDVRHRATLVILRRADVDLAADLDGIAFDREAAPGGVHIAHAERDHLAPADAGVREHQETPAASPASRARRSTCWWLR